MNNRIIVILPRGRKIIFHDPIGILSHRGISHRLTVESDEYEETYEGEYKAYTRLKDRERKRRKKLRESCMPRQEGR